VTSAYVDFNVEESGIDIDNIWHTYSWEKLSFSIERNNPVIGVADTFEIIPNPIQIKELQVAIKEKLQLNNILYAKEKYEGQNQLIADMLSAIEPLVSYGFL
jgi:hypothetical protein